MNKKDVLLRVVLPILWALIVPFLIVGYGSPILASKNKNAWVRDGVVVAAIKNDFPTPGTTRYLKMVSKKYGYVLEEVTQSSLLAGRTSYDFENGKLKWIIQLPRFGKNRTIRGEEIQKYEAQAKLLLEETRVRFADSVGIPKTP